MAYGYNLGLTQMVHAIKLRAQSTLGNTVNWCFSLGSPRQANDAVVAQPSRLPVNHLLQRHPKAVHTSSDGQVLRGR